MPFVIPCRLGAIVAVVAGLAVPATAMAQTAAPEAGDSSAAGILAVLGFGALLAAGIYFWARGDEPAPDDPAERDDETPGAGQADG